MRAAAGTFKELWCRNVFSKPPVNENHSTLIYANPPPLLLQTLFHQLSWPFWSRTMEPISIKMGERWQRRRQEWRGGRCRTFTKSETSADPQWKRCWDVFRGRAKKEQMINTGNALFKLNWVLRPEMCCYLHYHEKTPPLMKQTGAILQPCPVSFFSILSERPTDYFNTKSVFKFLIFHSKMSTEGCIKKKREAVKFPSSHLTCQCKVKRLPWWWWFFF